MANAPPAGRGVLPGRAYAAFAVAFAAFAALVRASRQVRHSTPRLPVPVAPLPVTVGNALTFFTSWQAAQRCSVTAVPSKVRASFFAFGASAFGARASHARCQA
jgi:hypothetical protein